MSPKQTDVLIETYKRLARVPALVKAKFLNATAIESVWSERNLEKGKTIKFASTFYSIDGNISFKRLPPVDITSQLLCATSPCKQFHAIIRDVEGKDPAQPSQYLEIWNQSALIKSIDLTALDLHAKVYTDDEFGSFKWSPTGGKLLYVAEKKEPKPDPINKRPKPKKEGSDGDKPDEDVKKDIIQCHDYKQDWGEALVGKIKSILVIYDMELDEFTIPECIPENVCVAKPVWSPDAKSIIGICYYTEPRKLGLIYCGNRPSSLFTFTLEGTYEELSKLKNVSVKSPTITADGKELIWLQHEAGGPHINCSQLYRTTLPLSDNNEFKLVVDSVDKSIDIGDGCLFYGLYNIMIPDRCWTNDGRLLFSNFKQNYITSYVLDIQSGKLTELAFNEGSQLILDVCDDNILINRRNYFQQDVLHQAKLPATNEKQLKIMQVSETNEIECLQGKMFRYLDLSHKNGDEIDNFTAIYIGPKSCKDAKCPLVIFPHGGPHSQSSNLLTLEVAFLLATGYAIVQVNYRGSIGAGKRSLQFLTGKVGTTDVADCILATDSALEIFPWLDRNRVALVGGSHGGFLVTHLSGQYPDKYRAVVARNPVVDIATMSGGSDIPDWCYVEAGYPYSQEGAISDDILLAMRRKSPIVHAHKVKAPTLMQIGMKDLRVPPYQGIDYYHRLKANKIPISMNVYEDNHPLGQVPNEMGHVLSTAKWLNEHNN